MDYSSWRRFGIIGVIRHLRIADVKNDIDLIRKILTEVRNRDDLWPKVVEIEGYEPIFVARHVERLFKDGFLDAAGSHQPLSAQAPLILVRDLTTAGHEFLAALENQDVWSRLKSALNPQDLAALSLKELGKIAAELAGQVARRKLGLD